MPKDLRPTLFAASFAAAALTGCGGGGGVLGSPPPSGGSQPPPSAPGTYFQAARAGASGNVTPNNISFATGPVGASKFELAFIDPVSPPGAFNFTNGIAPNQLEPAGFGYDFGTFSEYFPAAGGGTATSWGTRYWVYADASAGALYAVDLRKSGNAIPVATQISSGTVSTLALCSTPAPSLFDNYRSANRSWIVFHVFNTADMNCGSLDDNFVAVQMSMSAATAPMKLGQLEPVEALYDTFGTIIGYLAINHPAVNSMGAPSTPVPLQQLDSSFNVKTTFASTLGGNGLNTAGGDFLSLGVSGNSWLYVDASGVFSLNLSTGATTGPIFTLAAGDAVQSRAVFDGTNAYVAVNNAAGSYVVMVNTSNNSVAATQTADATAPQIMLVGVTSGNLVYLVNNGTAIKSLVKSNLTGLTTLKTLTATQTIDALMGPAGAAGPPVAFLVGNTLFFTVADTAGVAKQAFYVVFSGTTPGTATAVASTVSAVLGVVAPATIPTSGTITYSNALVMTGGATSSGQAVFASSAPVTASLGLYSASGTLTTAIGTLSSTNVATGSNFGNPMTGVALNSGPVQAAMPSMLLLFGKDGTGAVGQDIALYSSDNSTPFAQLSGFDQ
jgi:hypothetical protein